MVLTDPPYNVDAGNMGDTNEQFDNRRIKTSNMLMMTLSFVKN